MTRLFRLLAVIAAALLGYLGSHCGYLIANAAPENRYSASLLACVVAFLLLGTAGLLVCRAVLGEHERNNR